MVELRSVTRTSSPSMRTCAWVRDTSLFGLATLTSRGSSCTGRRDAWGARPIRTVRSRGMRTPFDSFSVGIGTAPPAETGSLGTRSEELVSMACRYSTRLPVKMVELWSSSLPGSAWGSSVTWRSESGWCSGLTWWWGFGCWGAEGWAPDVADGVGVGALVCWAR